MDLKSKRKTVDIERGLLLVRYAGAEDEAHPPKIRLSCEPGAEGNISFVLHPDQAEAELWQPGQCLVARATARVRLAVDVIATSAAGSAAATVRIEPLPFTRSPNEADGRSACNLADFRVRGHVAGIGDVVVAADQWLAGPAAPSRIEGLALEWPSKPRDIDIRYCVKTARAQAQSGVLTELGGFAGTRGKALPVVGIAFELSGPGAADFQLFAEAIFLGSLTVRGSGRQVSLSGPTNREPLVGLRLRLEQVNAGVAPAPMLPASRLARSSGRVRVFRSQAQGSEATA
jgi:hypothetical protein